MLTRCFPLALVFAVSLGASLAVAETKPDASPRAPAADSAAPDRAASSPDQPAAAEADVAPARSDSDASKAGAIYPHIYQAPLFGSVFAVTSTDAAVDESALRYYASLHNVGRANAEIRRLKALHPNWTPPTNIYSTAGAGTDEQPFWDLLAADRFDELRAGIAVRMKSEPGWKPSRDLSTKIERKEAIEKLVKVSDQSKWDEVLEIADANPSILHCAYMDANWRVADAFLNIGLSPRAFEIYHAIIASCADHDERVTTIRKAIARFTVDQAKSLIAMGAQSGDGAREFDGVKLDLTRARIAAINARTSDDVLEPEALADFLAEVTRTRDPVDVGLAAWFEYDRGNYQAADKWFSLVTPAEPPGKDPGDIKFAEGHALSLLKSGNIEAAVRVAWAWRATSETMRGTYVGAMITLLTLPETSAPLPDAMMRDFVDFVQASHSFEGAQALAWHHQSRSEWDDSATWFRAALGWKNVEPAATPSAGVEDPQILKAIEGYAIALTNLGRVSEAVDIADAWRGVNSDLRKLFLSLATNAINGADRADIVAPEALAHLAELVRADRALDGASALGWLNYRSGEYDVAVDWFNEAISWSPSGKGDLKTNQGLGLALQQEGKLAEAEEIAWSWRKQSPDMRELYVAAFIGQTTRDDLRGQISAARLDRFIGFSRADRSALGAQALGWYRLQQGNCFYAAPWFRAAAAWSAQRDDDPKTAEGLGLSLSAVGRFTEAEDIAYSWRDRSPTLRALYMKVVIEELTRDLPVAPTSEARLDRFSAIVLEERSAPGARALGWRRYRQAGNGYGADWFRLATQWVDDDQRDVKTDEGYSLSLRAVGRLTDAEALAKRWAAKDATMKQLYIDTVVEELSRDNPPEPLEETRVADFVATIEPIKSPLGAQALGWYRLERGETAEAGKWFKNALDWWPQRRKDQVQHLSGAIEDYQPISAKLALEREDYRRTPLAFPNSSARIAKTAENYVDTIEGFAKTTEGYALTLRALGRASEAEDIAFAWRDRWPPLRKLFDDIAATELSRADGPPIAAEKLRRYTQSITENRSAAGAQALAWRQYAANDFTGAIQWFRSAMDWSGGAANANPDPRLAEGYVLALRGAKKFDDALEVAGRYRAKSPRFNLLYLETALMKARGAGGALSAEKYAEIETAMNDSHSAEGALDMGWLAFGDKDYPRALTWFQNALDWGVQDKPDPKALEGYALALRMLGRQDDLASFAKTWRDTSPQVRGAYYAGMIEQLTRADPLAAINPDTQADFEAMVEDDRSPAGAQAIAWGLELRQDFAGSVAWFEHAMEWSAFDPTAPRAGGKVDNAHAKLVEGYVLAIRGAGELDRAEEIAYAWRDGPSELRGLYMQIFTQELAKADSMDAFSPERLDRFAKIAQKEHSAIAAENLGWFGYRAGQANAALSWFELAISWSPGKKGDAKANEGYALSLRAVGRWVEAEDFAWAHRDQAKELRQAYVAAVSDQLFDTRRAAEISPARLERFAGIVRADKLAAGAQALGWLFRWLVPRRPGVDDRPQGRRQDQFRARAGAARDRHVQRSRGRRV
jgi:tetratricopeptide (TPR) repeat protein